jgi:F-type H+-transporting ATPase subunit c
MELNTLIAIGAGIAVATGIGAGIGIGIATAGFLQAIARQPEAAGKMTPMFFVGVALAESTAIYGLVIAIMLITRL